MENSLCPMNLEDDERSIFGGIRRSRSFVFVFTGVLVGI